MRTFGKYGHTPGDRLQDRVGTGCCRIRAMMMTNACTPLALPAPTLLIVVGIAGLALTGRMCLAWIRSSLHMQAGCQQSEYNTKKEQHLTHREAS